MGEVTSIDLGSNSFRVLVYNYKKNIILKEYNKIVGTADRLVDTGVISDSAIQRIISAIKDSTLKLGYIPNDCVGVTTAAMRIAKNRVEVLDEIHRSTGVKLKVINAHEEARLTLLAIKYALKRENNKSENFVLLDIGGGSVELIINSEESFFIKSFDFGIVTLEQLHNNKNKLKDDLENKKVLIKKYLDTLDVNFNDFEFIATAGTPTTIAAIKHGQKFSTYDKNIVNGTIVNLNDLNDCLDLLNQLNGDKLIEIFGTNKKEFIEVGILIFKTMFEVLNKKESIVFDDGLREGVAINYGNIKEKLHQ